MVEPVRKAVVISNKNVSEKISILELKCDGILNVEPGQFILIYPEADMDFILPRPFSIFDVDGERMFILYKVVGRFTAFMRRWHEGYSVRFGGPYGRGFEVQKGKRAVLIAGGTGIASLNLLGKRLQNSEIVLYYGVKSESELVPPSTLSFKFSDLIISTEDGSLGKKGMITDFLEGILKTDIVYSAGPMMMLEKVVKSVEAERVFVSMEGRMACGVGICMGCGIFTRDNDVKRVCCDGPVFDGRSIKWEDLV